MNTVIDSFTGTRHLACRCKNDREWPRGLRPCPDSIADECGGNRPAGRPDRGIVCPAYDFGVPSRAVSNPYIKNKNNINYHY